MNFKDSKVAIIGCGNVGATIGYTLINQGLCESIALIDQNKLWIQLLDKLCKQDSTEFLLLYQIL